MTPTGRLGDIPRGVWFLLVVGAVAVAHYWTSGDAMSAWFGVGAGMLAVRQFRESRPPDRVRVRLTRVGYLVMGVGAVGLVMARADVLLTALVVLVAGAVTAARDIGGVQLEAMPPASATVGEQLPVDVRVTGARGPVEIMLLDPPSAPVLVDGAAHGPIIHSAQHRGVFHALRSVVRSRGWLGVCDAVRPLATLLDRPIQVLPRPRRTPDVPPLRDVAAGPDGPSGPTRGQGGLPRGVRPYSPGDARHHVHWPSSARAGSLVVTEVDTPSRPTVDVVVELPDAPELMLTSDIEAWQATVDDLTGRALYGIGDLLAQGVPVRLVTIEAADLSVNAADTLVTDLVPDRRTAAVRLARARPGRTRERAPAMGEVVWLVAAAPDETDRTDETDEAPEDPRHATHVERLESVTSGRALATTAIIGTSMLSMFGDDELPRVAALFLPMLVGVGVFHLVARTRPHAVHVALAALATLPVLVAWAHPPVRVGWVLPAVAAGVAVSMTAERRVEVLSAWCHRSPPRPWTRVVAITATVAAWLAWATVARPPLPVAAVAAATVAGLGILLGSQVERVARLDGPPSVPDRMRMASRWAVLVAVLVALLPLGQAARDRWSPREAGGDGGGAASDAQAASTTDVGPWVYGTSRVDGQTRPPNSDAEVMWVSTDRPLLLRGQTFDTFDGRAWTQSWSLAAHGSDTTPPPGARVTQQVTIRADGATVLPAAPVATQMGLPTADHLLQRLDDGGLYADPPLRRGDTYTVVSVLPDATPTSLRAAGGAVPEDVRTRYGQAPPLSARAAALVDEVAGDLPSAYDQVLALQAMLADRVTYSLDAPLPPVGADVVDHFLFEARSGWCEQIAATLTASMRHLGVPARLVTGFAPGEWDAGAGHFVVRARDAHAWVEVYFPGVGWQGFDPTAEVPLTGEPPAALPVPEPTPLWPALAVAAALVATVVLAAALRRWRSRTPPPTPTWVDTADARLRELGDDVGVPRSPTEGVTRHGRRLARVLGDPAIEHAARAVEHAAYGPTPLPDADRVAAEATLAAATERLAPR